MVASTCAFAVAVLVSAPPGSLNPYSLESLQAEHAAHAAAIQSLVVEEIVHTQDARTPEREAELRERLSARAAERPGAADGAAAAGSRADRYMPVWLANGTVATREKYTLDATTGRYRHETTDLRDLDAIAAELDLSATQMRNLDQSRTTIGGSNYSVMITRFTPSDALAVVLPGSAHAAQQRLDLLGIVAPRYLSADWPTEVTTDAAGDIHVRTTRPGTDSVAVELVLRGAEGHHLKHLVAYDEDGERVHEIKAGDYRTVEPGVQVPFRVETWRRYGGNAGERNETHEVERVAVNSRLAADAFDVPEGVRLQRMNADAWEAFQADRAAREPDAVTTE